ncbi:MAG: single-stranded DNA-binding protein [Rhodocyclaceae bacterium]|nr:MAG: single-stranded DNA-binding protein [Rhodocyclaceae bacterium]
MQEGKVSVAGVNKVILIGNLGADPELRQTQGGPVCNMRVATTERWTNQDGQKQERTEWHNVVVWGRMAENCQRYLAKGRPVYVEGRLQSRTYNDQEGKERRTWDVQAQTIQFLGGGPGGEDAGNEGGGGRSSGGNQRGGGGGGGSQGGGWGGPPAGGGGGGWGGPKGGGADPGFDDDDPIPF